MSLQKSFLIVMTWGIVATVALVIGLGPAVLAAIFALIFTAFVLAW